MTSTHGGSAAHEVRPVAARSAARAALAALAVLAVVDMFHLFMSIGHYEYRITVVTHGQPDLAVAAFGYELFDRVVSEVGYLLGLHIEVDTVRWGMWALALVIALATVTGWLHRARATVRMDRATLGWLGAALTLKVLSALYDAFAAPPAPSVGGVLATRPIAYPLWIVSTVVLVAAVLRVARTIRREDGNR